MASGVESPKTVASPDAFVRRRLTEVCQRIRLHDVLASLLRLGLAVGGYLLTMALFDLATADRASAWVDAVRWGGFVGFVIGLVVLVAQLARAVLRPVNPYYAARRLEQTVPDAKNGLINWLDLNDEKLPGTFLKNLNARAAEQLEQSDPDEALDRRRHGWMLALGGVLLVGLLVLFARGPGQFLSLAQRALLPFTETQVAARTRIALLRPEHGDARVRPNQAVAFAAQIEGLVPALNTPGAPALLYRYQAHDPYLTLPLHQDDQGRWHARLLADQVRTGCWYKIAAGDAETPEYQIEVRSQPHARQVEVTYHHRPYRRTEDATTVFPNEHAAVPHLAGQRGTMVEMVVRTDRDVKQAGVELVTKQGRTLVAGQMLADDPQTFRCRWVLEKTGQFRIVFTSIEDEENVDRTPRDMVVLEDEAPRVTLTQPGQDIELPTNGTLALAGIAQDDFGIKALSLRLRLVDSPADVPLKSKPYRAGKPLHFADGRFPDTVEYKDIVALDQVKNERGQPFALEAGKVLEYWLEAVDNSDYPSKVGNVGKSTVYKVNLVPPADAQQQQADRQQKADAQQKHEKQQDDKQKQGPGNKGQSPTPAGGQGDNQENKNTDDKVKQAFQEQQRQQERGNAKEQEPQQGEAKAGPDGAKDQPQPQPKEGKGDQNDKGDAKEKGKENAGASKDGGEKEKQPDEGASKGMNKPQPQQGGGEAKDQGQDSKDKQPGNAKAGDATKKPGNEAAPQAKEEKVSPDAAPAQAKADGARPPPEVRTPGNAKGPDEAKAEAKASAPAPNSKNEPQAQAKPGHRRMKPAAVPQPEEAKQGPSGPADGPGAAKGDPPPEAKTRQPTWAEIEQLIDRMKEKKGLDETAKELADAGQKAADPKLRAAAQEALIKADRDAATGEAAEPGSKTAPGTAQKTEPPPMGPQGTKPGPLGDPATQQQTPGTPLTPDEANAKYANRAGNLQLDDWRKQITPEILERAKVTEAEWQRALQAAAQNRAGTMTPTQGAKLKRPDARATGNTLPSVAPSEVSGLTPGRNDAVDAGRAAPPPELRDPQRRFSSRPTP